MKIAVISDTHDRMSMIIKTVEILNRMELELVVHCGDYSAPFAIEPYANLAHPMIGIFGNNDAEKGLITSKFKQYRKEIRGEFVMIKLGGLKAVVLHGHDTELLEALVESKGFDLVLYGHTHEPKIEYGEINLMLNPGEVCGYLTGESTFAVLDTNTMKAELIDIA